jgi:hypothetical protein
MLNTMNSRMVKNKVELAVKDCIPVTIQGDGSKWGISDFYPHLESKLIEVLGLNIPFTTDWFSSKKEIVSGKISGDGKGNFICEASASDDFDSQGVGEVVITVDPDSLPQVKLDEIRGGLDSAHDLADEDLKDNRTYFGFSIHDKNGSWVETYIAPRGDALEYGLEEPSGDYYHEWGFQGDSKLPKKTKDAFERWANEYTDESEVKELTIGKHTRKYTIKAWKV